MGKLKKVFCCYNFLNFQCSNIFLQCSLLVFQFHSGSKAVSLKRSATSRPSVSRLCPLSRHTFNPSFTGKQVTHTRKIFSHSKFRKLQQQSTISLQECDFFNSIFVFPAIQYVCMTTSRPRSFGRIALAHAKMSPYKVVFQAGRKIWPKI